jgi:GTP pyrophosphokinase
MFQEFEGIGRITERLQKALEPLMSSHVEIVTASHAKPNPAWLNYVATGKARSHIRRFLKTMQYEESAGLGERMLNQAFSSFKVDPQTVSEAQWEKTARESGAKSKKDLLADIGLGKHLPAVMARRLAASPGESLSGTSGASDVITILGTEGMAVQFAKCCRPIPGDSIVGFIKKDQGLVIHIQDCPTVAKSRGGTDNWLDVAWGKGITRQFEVSIKILVANQRGVLARVAAAIADAGSNIDNVAMDGEGTYTTMTFMLQVRDRYHLAQVMRGLRRISEVAKITRIKG